MGLFLGVVLWATAGPAVCQAPSPRAESRPAARAPRPPIDLERVRLAFRALDADRGGSISWSEAKAAGLDAPRFAAQDLDGDGAVSRDEFDWVFAHQSAQRGQALDADVKARLAELAARGFPRTARGESRPASRPGAASRRSVKAGS
jgi:hypothetical protein